MNGKVQKYLHYDFFSVLQITLDTQSAWKNSAHIALAFFAWCIESYQIIVWLTPP